MTSFAAASLNGRGEESGADTPRTSAGGGAASSPVGEPNTGGRPTKYEPRFCDEMIEHCAGGASLTSFAAQIGVARKTLFNWAEQNAEFADALEVAKARACAWWEERARSIAEGDGGPGAASVCVFALKNFGTDDFTDRREVTYGGSIQHNLTYEQAIEEARRRGLPERVLIADNRE